MQIERVNISIHTHHPLLQPLDPCPFLFSGVLARRVAEFTEHTPHLDHVIPRLVERGATWLSGGLVMLLLLLMRRERDAGVWLGLEGRHAGQLRHGKPSSRREAKGEASCLVVGKVRRRELKGVVMDLEALSVRSDALQVEALSAHRSVSGLMLPGPLRRRLRLLRSIRIRRLLPRCRRRLACLPCLSGSRRCGWLRLLRLRLRWPAPKPVQAHRRPLLLALRDRLGKSGARPDPSARHLHPGHRHRRRHPRRHLPRLSQLVHALALAQHCFLMMRRRHRPLRR